MKDTIEHFGRWPEEKLENLNTCVVCTSAEKALVYNGLADLYFSTKTKDWKLWACLNCGSYYLNPRPTLDSIGEAYGGYFSHRDPADQYRDDNGTSMAWKMVNGYLYDRHGMDRQPRLNAGAWLVAANPLLKLKLDYFARNLGPGRGRSLLDVGCGNGLFLLRAVSSGWKAEGIDVDIVAVDQAKKAGLVAHSMSIFEAAKNMSRTYDAITLSHVLEHFHDPVEALRCCMKMLKPDGRIWLSTPNMSSLPRHIFGKKWIGLDPPRHLVLFNRRSAKKALLDSGFVDVRFHRRGAHNKFMFRSSYFSTSDISGIQIPMRVKLTEALFDAIGLINPTFSEELVITARRH